MGLDNLKRWHWCLIGIAFGAAFAAIKIWAGPAEPRGTQTMRPVMFEQHLLHHQDATGRRVQQLDHFVIHAAQPHPGAGGTVTSEFLSFDALVWDEVPKLKPGEKRPVPATQPQIRATWWNRQLVMEDQSDRDKSILGVDVRKMNVRDYLDKLKEKIAADPTRYPNVPAIVYKYNWLESERGAYTVYCTAGFVIVGLVWPTVISLLSGNGLGLGLGFGRASGAKDDYDLSRFKGERSSAKARPVVTDEELERLAKMEADLEAKLKAGAKPREVRDAEVVEEPVVPVLKGGPLQVAPELAAKQEAPRKGFGADQGDYYPTEVHGKKKE